MLSAKECNAMQKVLLKECQEFTEKIRDQFKSPSCQWDARTLSIVDGPALMLGMDTVLAEKLEIYTEEHQNQTQQAHIIDREHLGKQYLVKR